MGRGLSREYQLLHVFEGFARENQTLEYIPETPVEDISTVRIEILDGSGWVGFREIQVYSRDEPKPLPVTDVASPPEPLFSAHVKPDELEVITPENAGDVRALAMFGRGTINQLTWSPDGQTLAVAGALGVWLYDAAVLDSPPRLFEGHTRDVLNMTFSPDGSILFSGSQDGTVRHVDPATGELKRESTLWNDFSYEVGSQTRNPEVWSMVFNSDQTLLAAGSFDGSLHLWDLSRNRERATLNGHNRQIASLAFSSDSSLLASSSYDGKLLVWDVESGSQSASLSGHSDWVPAVAFSPDGKLLASSSLDRSLRLWSTESGRQVGLLTGH